MGAIAIRVYLEIRADSLSALLHAFKAYASMIAIIYNNFILI